MQGFPQSPGLKQSLSFSVLRSHLILFLELTTIQYFPYVFVYCLSSLQWAVREAEFYLSLYPWTKLGSAHTVVANKRLLNDYVKAQKEPGTLLSVLYT